MWRCSVCGYICATMFALDFHKAEEHPDVAPQAEDQGKVPAADDGQRQEASAGDRAQAGFSEERIREIERQNAYAQEVRREAEEARQRDLLGAPYKIRVQLNNPAQNFVDLDCIKPWQEWCLAFLEYAGIIHDKGLIPRESIAFIVRLDPQGQPAVVIGENVVPFKKP